MRAEATAKAEGAHRKALENDNTEEREGGETVVSALVPSGKKRPSRHEASLRWHLDLASSRAFI